MHPQHRYASARCPNPIPKKRPNPPEDEDTKLPPKRSETETVSFDRLVMVSLHRILLLVFSAANPHPEITGWHWPSLRALLVELWYAVYSHETKKGISYGDAQEKHGLELVVAIVDDLDEGTIRKVRARDLSKKTIFGRWKGMAYKLRPLLSMAPFPDVLLPDCRWEVVRSKISTPRGNRVHGPYLAVMLVEQSTGLVVRARFIPLWFDLTLDRVGIARSKPECYQLQAVSDAGGVAFTSTIHSQLEDLQKQFGHRWAGDIGSYGYLPDPILMPAIGQKPTITEFFGMARFRHYAKCIVPKLLAGAKGMEKGLFNFKSLEGKRGSIAAIEKQIRDWVAGLYDDPSNGLFQAEAS